MVPFWCQAQGHETDKKMLFVGRKLWVLDTFLTLIHPDRDLFFFFLRRTCLMQMRFSTVIYWCSSSEALEFHEHIHFIIIPRYHFLRRRLVYPLSLTVHNNLEINNNQLLKHSCAWHQTKRWCCLRQYLQAFHTLRKDTESHQHFALTWNTCT